MSSANISPVNPSFPKRRERWVQLPLQYGPPIRQVLELSPDADDEALRKKVIDFFVSGLLREVFNLEPGATDEILNAAIEKRVLEVINDEFKYALKNLDSDIDKAKQKHGLPAEASVGAVYRKELESGLNGLVFSIVGTGHPTEFKILTNIENKDDLYQDMKTATVNCLRKRTRGFRGEEVVQKTDYEVLADHVDLPIRAQVIPRVHGYNPESKGTIFYTSESHPGYRMPVRYKISRALTTMFGTDFGFIDAFYEKRK